MQKFQAAFVKVMDTAPGTVNGAAELYLPHYDNAPSELHRGMYA